MNRKQHTDLMILSGHTYKNGSFELPEHWQEIGSYRDNNGFQATVYKNGNEISISYRGSEATKIKNYEFAKDIYNDIQMGINNFPNQYKSANEVYKQIKQSYPNSNITVTGHSLGGSLAQLVSAENGCPAVTFNAYGTGDILSKAGYNNTKTTNIINYGNPKDNIFNLNPNQPGRTFVTNTDFNKRDNLIWAKSDQQRPWNFDDHPIEQMGPLEDAVEIKPTITEYNATSPFQLYAEKTFTREEIAQMSNDEFAKNEQQIMEQLKNGQIKAEKPDYKNFTNPNTGSKKIYTKEELEKMSPDEFMKNESEIMGQLQSIGLPQKSDLPQKYSNSSSGDGKWVTINGNHVLIEK
ncbi:MAG: DUF2974 domain-containing protein [Fusobacterium sp.]|nr:DUF2974 domain-containing protein [Fusobacterium sp.]